MAALSTDLARENNEALPRGAVGRFNGNVAEFGYPEIAGYWLGWAADHPSVSEAAGENVISWLTSAQEPEGTWPTRLGSSDIEYQRTRYLFDHAMLWHGVARWADRRASTTARILHPQVTAALVCFADDTQLHSILGPAIPRWSGQSGPFLLKALARIRHVEPLQQKVNEKIRNLTALALNTPHQHAHPQLYAIEGLWLLDEIEIANQALHSLLVAQGGIESLRESIGQGPRRNDVIAQTLRAALLLGWPIRGNRQWARTYDRLVNAVPTNGRLPFSKNQKQSPTWTAIFAEQAVRAWQGAGISKDELA